MKDAPREFVLFLQAVVKRGRHRILREIAHEYLVLLDQKLERVRAGVTLARKPDAKLQRTLDDTTKPVTMRAAAGPVNAAGMRPRCRSMKRWLRRRSWMST